MQLMQLNFELPELALLRELVEKSSAPAAVARTLGNLYDKITSAHDAAKQAEKSAAGASGGTSQ